MERIKELVRPFYLRWIYFPLFPARRPDAFLLWLNHRILPLEPAALAEHFPPSETPGFVFYPMTDWHFRMQRSQHLATALRNTGAHVFFLNPHLGRQYPTAYFQRRGPELGLLPGGIGELHVRLPAEPVFHNRKLTSAESDRCAQAVSLLRTSSPRGMVQVVSFPTWLDTAFRLRKRFGWPVVYDCHDYLRGFRGIAPELIEQEEHGLRQADLILYSSPALLDWGSRVAPDTPASLLRNGVAAAHFAEAARSWDARTRGVRPVAGYVGALAEWFDWDSLRKAASELPEVDFRLFGSPPQVAPSLPANVTLEGEIPYERVPAALSAFDVALIPFRVNELTRSTNPVKLYEYFSVGMPVVSSPLPEVQQYRDLVYFADADSGYAAAIRKALADTDAARLAQRRAIAGSESWDSRAQELLNQVQRKFPALFQLP